MYLVNGGSPKTLSSHSCDTVMPLSLRRRDWLAAGVRRPLKNASPILSGAGCGMARHALQKLPRSSARFGLSAVPPQAGPTRSRPAPARKQENRGGGCLTPFAIFGSWDFTSDRSAAKSHLRQLLSPSPRGNIAIFRMPSLASRSVLSSLSSCVMTLDERDGSDERDGRGDDVGFHVGSFRTEISCRGPRRHENRRSGNILP